jgi:elongation factor Ts
MSVEITAALVKELRDRTNVSMMECRKALTESGGDPDKAVTWLRERGLAVAAKKADRAAEQGLVAAAVSEDGARGALVEVNCETDFVAKNENFQAFVAGLTRRALDLPDGGLAEAAKADVAAKIAEIGENIVVGRNIRYDRQGSGVIATYIHLGGKVGVIMELGTDSDAVAAHPSVREVGRDLCLHVAALDPVALRREDVPAAVVEAEKSVYAKQVEDKPEKIRAGIVQGKLNKFYQTNCLLEQGFVKDPEVTVTQLLDRTGKTAGGALTLRRFARVKVGK